MNYAFHNVEVQAPTKLIRPNKFRPAHCVLSADFMLEPPACFTAPRRATPRQKNGLRYERKVLEALESEAGFRLFVPSPWIEFTNQSGRRFCQPDALGFHQEDKKLVVTIFEIKLSHTIKAYWQLRRLYEPVVRRLLPKYEVRVCEITRHFDPFTPWPEPLALCMEPTVLKQLDAKTFGVLSWRI